MVEKSSPSFLMRLSNSLPAVTALFNDAYNINVVNKRWKSLYLQAGFDIGGDFPGRNNVVAMMLVVFALGTTQFLSTAGIIAT